MGRPPLPLGTHGEIAIRKLAPAKYQARCRYRHFDGKYHYVARSGSTKTQAENRLKEAVRDFIAPVEGEKITPNTKFKDAAAEWLREYEKDAAAELRSWGTVDTYRSRLEGIVNPAVGELRGFELKTPIFDTLCRNVRDTSSASSARTVRAICAGVCQLFVRHGVLDANPVREISPLENKKGRRQPAKSRALDRDQVVDLFAKLDADEEACQADLPDLVRFFLATGERTGEALGAHWPDYDKKRKQIAMAGNVIRAKGKGKILNRGKTENSARGIPLADWGCAMLDNRMRAATNLDGPIFPSTTGTIREASNIRNRSWNPFLKRAGYEWVTFRSLRKTVATLLDEAGLTARQIADILGHARPSMTQDVYMGRGATTRVAAEALDDLVAPNSSVSGE